MKIQELLNIQRTLKGQRRGDSIAVQKQKQKPKQKEKQKQRQKT